MSAFDSSPLFVDELLFRASDDAAWAYALRVANDEGDA